MAGRPSSYTEALAAEICKRMAEGESLRRICQTEGMPNRGTVLAWAMDPSHPFYNQYARARDLQADTLADEIQDIADDGTNDFTIDPVKGAMVNHDHIQRSRLRVDTRKWIASKLKPKRYGDKQHVEHSGTLTLESLVTGSQNKSDE